VVKPKENSRCETLTYSLKHISKDTLLSKENQKHEKNMLENKS
jgi:hypothetical protein